MAKRMKKTGLDTEHGIDRLVLRHARTFDIGLSAEQESRSTSGGTWLGDGKYTSDRDIGDAPRPSGCRKSIQLRCLPLRLLVSVRK